MKAVHGQKTENLKYLMPYLHLQYICNFGIWPTKEQMSIRQGKFNLRYFASESAVCRAVIKYDILFKSVILCILLLWSSVFCFLTLYILTLFMAVQ